MKYQDKNATDLLTPTILATGPEVVALFTAYVNTANAMHHHKATKAQMQAAYKAYDHAFLAAYQAAAKAAAQAARRAENEAMWKDLEADPEFHAWNARYDAQFCHPLPEDFGLDPHDYAR